MPPVGIFMGLHCSYMKWVSELQYRRELYEPRRKIKFLEIFKGRKSFPLTTKQRRPQRKYYSDLDAREEYNTRLKSENLIFALTDRQHQSALQGHTCLFHGKQHGYNIHGVIFEPL